MKHIGTTMRKAVPKKGKSITKGYKIARSVSTGEFVQIKGRAYRRKNPDTIHSNNISDSRRSNIDVKPNTFETKLRKTGSAVGATIPADFLRQLELKAGDKVTVSVDEGGVKIVKSDPAFDSDMAHYEIIEDRFSPAFRKLAE